MVSLVEPVEGPITMQPKISWFVYIVRCSDNSYYAGISPDVTKRVQLHNLGKGSHYTAAHRPVVLVYSKEFSSKSEARKREIQLKRWSHLKKEKLISGKLQ